jgi:hypothetical protein
MGTTLISPLEYVSPSNSQQFPVKRAGGDAFSGYIPVMPSTGYSLSVWGKSAANTYGPVGIDPYTAHSGFQICQTNEWTIGPSWSWHDGSFTTASTTAYIKIKSEWWLDAPGDQPVYMDDLILRYRIASEPVTLIGVEETTLVVPVISNVSSNSPVPLGSPVVVTAVVSTAEGQIDAVTLRLVSPVSHDISMNLVSGTNVDGTWQGSYTPIQGGQFSTGHCPRHHGLPASSTLQTFDVTDNSSPQIADLTFTDPLVSVDPDCHCHRHR